VLVTTKKDILDFIVIGAPKAGTTSLNKYLRAHPEIALPAGEEQYFSHDAVYKRGWTTYISDLVANRYEETVDAARKWGTVTPQYMVGSVFKPTVDAAVTRTYDERTVPLRIHERLPDVRLVACLRDPVARAVSHHRMAAMVGRERRSFDDAIGELLRPEALERARRDPQDSRESQGYISWGEYGRILSGYFDVFAPEQILVVFTDELQRAPAQVLSRIQEFIGVSADFAPPNLGRRYRAGALERGFSWSDPSSWISPSSPLSPQAVRRAAMRSRAVRAAWHALPPAQQRRVAGQYQRLAFRVVFWNRRRPANQVAANAEPSPATLARLREHYAQDASELAALIGVTPSWLSSEDPA